MSLEVEVRAPTPEESVTAAKWPIWTKEESEFDWSYSQIEQCLILEGEVDIVADSKKWSFKAGDYVVFPKGLKCKWIVKKAVKKHYNFI